MTAEMTPEQFLRWRAYSIIEPFQDVRSDLQTAFLVKSLWDVNRDSESRKRQPLALTDFLLEYGGDFGKPKAESKGAPSNTQTVSQRTNALLQMAVAFAGKGEAKTKVEEIRRQLAERNASI